MAGFDETRWMDLRPSLGSGEAGQRAFVDHAKRLSRVIPSDATDAFQPVLNDSLIWAATIERPQALRAALHLLTDLARQRWAIRISDSGIVQVKRPQKVLIDVQQEKRRIREQELIRRNEQLREPAVRRFIRKMEKSVVYQSRPVSVLSLLRDGRDLALSLKEIRGLPLEEMVTAIRKVLDPYLQFVDEVSICQHTGLRLQDIWRYFRHTWSNQYTSTPGRWMAFLVRDRARKFHPIIGIGALGSPVIQIRERDRWIGWEAGSFLRSATEMPSVELGAWIKKIIDSAIDELFIDDFLEELLLHQRDLNEPSTGVISRLRSYGEKQRRLHHQFVQQHEHKVVDTEDKNPWETRARTHLFRSKRALALAEMLRARRTMCKFLSNYSASEWVSKMVETSEGVRLVKTILKKAKSDRVGIAMADITVCGAVEPYREILGGKLVSMLAASPEVIVTYRDRYGTQESEIASAMAGRPIERPANLVFLGTTSLYGVGSSQYNRLRIPAELLCGHLGEYLEFRQLGKSNAYGTSHFSSGTVEALVSLIQQTNNGQRVNSIFGEGVSPKMRKIREGLGVLGLPEDALLKHGRQRIVYGIKLIRNLKEFLLGLDAVPEYLIDLKNPAGGTEAIVKWWTERWLLKRIRSDQVLAHLDQQLLVRPIRHGARVVLPEVESTHVEDMDE